MPKVDDSSKEIDGFYTYQPQGASCSYRLNLFEAFDYIDALLKKVEDLEAKMKHVQALLDNDFR